MVIEAISARLTPTRVLVKSLGVAPKLGVMVLGVVVFSLAFSPELREIGKSKIVGIEGAEKVEIVELRVFVVFCGVGAELGAKRKEGRPIRRTPASVVQELTTCRRPKGSLTRKCAKMAIKTGEVKRMVVDSEMGM